jgi:hypothetical protein
MQEWKHFMNVLVQGNEELVNAFGYLNSKTITEMSSSQMLHT